MATVIRGDFEWDADKAAENLVKHGVSFVEAIAVLVSSDVVEISDAARPDRIQTIGFSLRARLLLVISIERAERIRIISARPASPAERRIFEEG